MSETIPTTSGGGCARGSRGITAGASAKGSQSRKHTAEESGGRAPSAPPAFTDSVAEPVSLALRPLLTDASKANAYLESRARTREARETIDSLQLLRVNDVCRLLRISKPTLGRLRRANNFPEPTEITDRVIGWRRLEIEAWLRARNNCSLAVRSSRGPQPSVFGPTRRPPDIRVRQLVCS